MFARRSNLSHCTDEDLMRRLVNPGDREALSELHRRYAERFLRYFVKVFKGDLQKAQDHLQDLFVRILEKKHQFDPEKKFFTWAFTIAVNLSRMSFREPLTQSLDELPHDQLPVEMHTTDQKLLRARLRSEIFALEDHHRAVFILRYTEGFSLQEIASITGTSLGTVKSRLFYATKKLSEKMNEHEPLFTEKK